MGRKSHFQSLVNTKWVKMGYIQVVKPVRPNAFANIIKNTRKNLRKDVANIEKNTRKIIGKTPYDIIENILKELEQNGSKMFLN